MSPISGCSKLRREKGEKFFLITSIVLSFCIIWCRIVDFEMSRLVKFTRHQFSRHVSLRKIKALFWSHHTRFFIFDTPPYPHVAFSCNKNYVNISPTPKVMPLFMDDLNSWLEPLFTIEKFRTKFKQNFISSTYMYVGHKVMRTVNVILTHNFFRNFGWF